MGRYKVGDKVRVREWDDMLKEFGGNDHAISCACSFTDLMKPLCGKVFTVIEERRTGSYGLDGEASGWAFSDDMLYPAITYREYMQENYPDDVSEAYLGGVSNCPDCVGLSGLGKRLGIHCAESVNESRCYRCWDQYMTEAEYKKYVFKEEDKEEMDYKVGDIAKVAKPVGGRTVSWVTGMNLAIGRVFKISKVDSDNTCQLEGADDVWFPFEALEPVSPKELLTPLCSVKLRNGCVYIFDGKNRLVREGRFLYMCDHNKNLNNLSNSDFDVMDICAPSDHVTELSEFLTKRGECIWKREEVVEITAEEAAKKLSEQYPGQTVKIIV